MSKLRTHFTFRVDTWSPDSESIVEHVAGVEDYQVALATYRTACERGLGTPAASLTTACMQAHATRFPHVCCCAFRRRRRQPSDPPDREPGDRDGYQRCDILFSASERYGFRISARSAQCSYYSSLVRFV